jgi:hypothetical protein
MRRIALIICCAAAMAALGADLAMRLESPGHRAARAVDAGYRHADMAANAEAAEDERLTRDADDAGYRWAERRSLDRAAGCAGLTPPFRAGCLAYVHEQGR